jgi:hypothetical protein
MILSGIFLFCNLYLILIICEIIVSEVYEWSGYEYPSHSYTNVAEMVPSNGTMTAAQLMNQLEEVGRVINNSNLQSFCQA